MTTDTKLEEKTAIKVTVPSLWKVVFLNDDKTPMEFVIQLLTEIFKHNDFEMLVVPWICKENEDEVMEFIKNSKSDLCFGHFEFTGFNMYKGVEAHGHFEAKPFEKYELVCSGHYHTKSKRDNVLYVGTPYEMTWQDYNDPRGHHLFDLETREITFHQNPYTIFVKLEYDDSKEIIDLDPLKDYVVFFVTKNRYGRANDLNILYERNMDFNTMKEIGYIDIPYDKY
jgi:hypothetical protein